MDKYKVLSLGWGVQSFTLAAMSALGEFEMPDVVIHADTTHEAIWTYEFSRFYSPWLSQHGMYYVRVQEPEINIALGTNVNKTVDIPAYTYGNGNGQIRRQCTGSWKIAPIRRWIQANRYGRPVEMWIGISTDEALRMKPSQVQYITHRWPLIELGMSRKDCVEWLRAHNELVPHKSSCYFCPYHTTEEWRMVQYSSDWEKACAIDEQIRNARPPDGLYVHPSRKPLAEVDLRTLEEKGQMRLWDEECEGICGI